jgi:dipeptidase D
MIIKVINLKGKFMNKISELSPKKVWEFFNKIASIPHASGHEEPLVNELISFAEERNLKYELVNNNLIIYKNASTSKESHEGVILQAHLDMVALKDKDVDFDFDKDPLNLIIEDNFIKANGTTLGADNGLGLAMILAILDDNSHTYPKLKAIFTIGEETDMVGANLLTKEDLNYPYLINLDSESFGDICIGCAGGASYDVSITPDISDVPEDFSSIKITIKGGIGGHSGMDINKKRLNAASALLTVINTLSNEEIKFYLSAINVGTVRNSIPSEGYAVIALPSAYIHKALNTLDENISRIKTIYQETDKKISIVAEKIENKNIMFTHEATEAIIALRLLNMRVLKTDENNEPLLSCNLGVIKYENAQCSMELLARANQCEDFDEIDKKITQICKENNAQVKLINTYTNWESNKESKLLQLTKESYEELFNEKPHVMTIHAGLECGLFKKVNNNLDIVSFGPDIFNAHSTKEKADILSTEKCYSWLVNLLEKI